MHRWYGHLSSLAVSWRQRQELRVSDISDSLGETTSPPIRMFAGSAGGGLKFNYDGAAANPTGTAGHGPFFCTSVV